MGKTKGNIAYVTIKLPQEITNEVDKLVGKHGFSSRTEVVKDALRDFFRKYPCQEPLKTLPNAEAEA